MSTYTPIASQTLTSTSSSIIFTNISQGYTDLILIENGSVNSGGGSYSRIRFNSDTNSNYSATYIYGNGTAAGSDRYSNQTFIPVNYVAAIETNFNHNSIINIQNYSNSTTYKTVLARSNNAATATDAAVALWRSTSAITSIEYYLNSGSWASGSTFNLYGIVTGSPKALGGNTVTTDGTYWYHTFTSSGVFTPSAALTADYLVVAGGGGGGGFGGGGGAGGLRSTVTATGGGGALESAVSLTAQAYTVTVGAGGTAGGIGGGSAYTAGGNGSNSVFSTITATGGGGGATGGSGGAGPFVAATGGSGGGGGASGNLTGAAGTANQGFAGGNGVAAPTYSGGGGGGAGVAGSGATGGNGVAVSITGSSVTYGGGGGGLTGSAGSGGGGAGGIAINTNPSGQPGTVNLGGGGGAGNNNVGETGGAGGSGIVIVRYLV